VAEAPAPAADKVTHSMQSTSKRAPAKHSNPMKRRINRTEGQRAPAARRELERSRKRPPGVTVRCFVKFPIAKACFESSPQLSYCCFYITYKFSYRDMVSVISSELYVSTEGRSFISGIVPGQVLRRFSRLLEPET
jgi:hypothetical protein